MTEASEKEKPAYIRATVCFLVKGEKILLAQKKKDTFGQGFLMGPGGKIEEGESAQDCAVRETEEEIGAKPLNLKWAGKIKFRHFQDNLPITQEVDFFVCDKWEGEPRETEEMKPEWFDHDAIPFERLLPTNDRFVGRMVDGEVVNGEITFDEEFKPLHADLVLTKAYNI